MSDEDPVTDPLALPDVFSGMVFFLSPNLADRQKIQRLLITFDGDVVNNVDSSVTHILVQDLDVDFWDDETKQATADQPGKIC